jgi:hypothetical protein
MPICNYHLDMKPLQQPFEIVPKDVVVQTRTVVFVPVQQFGREMFGRENDVGPLPFTIF